MLQWSACWFMTIYHAGMCSIWIEWFCIPRRPNLLIYLIHYLNRIVQSTKLTVHVRYSNQVMSPHTPKIYNWNESIILFFPRTIYPKYWKLKWDYYVIFFNTAERRLFFFSILSLLAYFFARSLLFALILSFTSSTFGCDAQLSALGRNSWFCLYSLRPCVCLSWCAPSWWDNSTKYLVLSPRPLRACMDSIVWCSKICDFGVTLSPSLLQVFM